MDKIYKAKKDDWVLKLQDSGIFLMHEGSMWSVTVDNSGRVCIHDSFIDADNIILYMWFWEDVNRILMNYKNFDVGENKIYGKGSVINIKVQKGVK